MTMSSAEAASLTAELQALAAETASERSPEHLAEALRSGCWIYGAGGYGRTVHGLLTRAGFACRGFVDRRAHGPRALDLPAAAVHPDAFGAAQAAGSVLVVALHNFAADQAPIVAWGRALGFAEVLTPAELPDVLGPEAGSYWLTGRRHAAEHIAEIVALIHSLADPRSVETVAALARYRITGDIGRHPASKLEDQYFPDDLPPPPEPVSLIDGGAFIGDIYDAAVRRGVRLDEWYAFEPDPDNFQKLAAAAALADVPHAALFPCGLGDACEQIRFSADEGSGSHMSTDAAATTTVNVVALDQVLKGARPTFVKLDIEGFERQALDGMRETLARSRPRIAMSIYHKPEDLWELPAKVHALLPDSRLYVRQHGFNGFDTVLYAIPPDPA